MAQELVTALFDRWNGRPILVIGGGPSATEDLALLVRSGFEPACVISANGHGAKQSHYKVDIFTNVDKQHCLLKVPMESIIRPLATEHNALVVNAHSWADYRMGDFTFHGNTGLSAIVLAAALSGTLVVPVGMDFFNGGHTYFHQPYPTKMKKSFALSRVARKGLKHLVGATAGANIRPISGPLLEFFQPFSPREWHSSCVPTPYRQHMLKNKTHYVTVHREYSFGSYDRAKVGTVLALTYRESLNPRKAGFAS